MKNHTKWSEVIRQIGFSHDSLVAACRYLEIALEEGKNYKSRTVLVPDDRIDDLKIYMSLSKKRYHPLNMVAERLNVTVKELIDITPGRMWLNIKTVKFSNKQLTFVPRPHLAEYPRLLGKADWFNKSGKNKGEGVERPMSADIAIIADMVKKKGQAPKTPDSFDRFVAACVVELDWNASRARATLREYLSTAMRKNA